MSIGFERRSSDGVALTIIAVCVQLPPELYAFLKRLLSLNPDERPSADDINRGITTGRLSDNLPLSRRRSSAGPEELTPGHRIQKLDTPTPGNSPNRAVGLGLENGTSRPKGKQPVIRYRSRSRERAKPSRLAQDSSTVDDDEDYQTADESDPEPPSASVIVRPKLPYPLLPVTNDIMPSPSPERLPQLLLPPPTEQNVLSTAVTLLRMRITSTSLRGLILVLKLLSTLQPCMSKGLNVAFVYPLLTLAALEVTLTPCHVWMAVSLGIVHVLALVVATRFNLLCSSNYGMTNIVTWDD
jgi:serine/threonine protein kinase